MFNLLVRGVGWADGRDSMSVGRVLEYTEDSLRDRFRPGGQLDLVALVTLPTLFMQESSGSGAELARVGTIFDARVYGKDIVLEYAFDPVIPAISNGDLKALSGDLDMDSFEFYRTHWAVKNVDLFKVLIRGLPRKRATPTVFQLSEYEHIEPILASAMMLFHPDFNAVYACIQKAAEEAGLRCRRADDIWENPSIIQDIVALIDRSRVVLADCTGRNPNVFYEIGIAHTLGREVILLTQSEGDIPFDLRHLRYLPYLNNEQGLEDLAERLGPRLENLAP